MGKRGNTMVEVMVSFVVLAMLAGIFANIVFFSGQTARKTEKSWKQTAVFLSGIIWMRASAGKRLAGEGLCFTGFSMTAGWNPGNIFP